MMMSMKMWTMTAKMMMMMWMPRGWCAAWTPLSLRATPAASPQAARRPGTSGSPRRALLRGSAPAARLLQEASDRRDLDIASVAHAVSRLPLGPIAISVSISVALSVPLAAPRAGEYVGGAGGGRSEGRWQGARLRQVLLAALPPRCGHGSGTVAAALGIASTSDAWQEHLLRRLRLLRRRGLRSWGIASEGEAEAGDADRGQRGGAGDGGQRAPGLRVVQAVEAPRERFWH
mmetsp:Transcript_18339/g.59561  ORF Transcript_18339/g.59561 Transcript_18339/m.59561 type:complete len:232 (-) Transcript_18339:1121-1816(-)